MKPRWALSMVVVLLGLLTYGYLRGAERMQENLQAEEATNDFPTWEPSAPAIKKAMAQPIVHDKTITDREAKEKRFRSLFESRFRLHEPQPMAIGLHFDSQNMLCLMCPARMEPWDMDLIAYMAWRETQDIFGHPFNIDMYETYIGTPKRKVGELRQTPDDLSKVMMTYVYNTKPSRFRHAVLPPHSVALP